DPAVEARRRRIILTGDVPSPVNPPSGCRFHTRCWLRERLGNPERCSSEDPALRTMASGHEVACHFAESVDGSTEQTQAVGAQMDARAAASGSASATAAAGPAAVTAAAAPPPAPRPPAGPERPAA
ncbi:MAG TPA: oligopeptide/dipeptide ABC transporter ATP-binding protein, partial [Candidatus Limnocylindrales bacterium]